MNFLVPILLLLMTMWYATRPGAPAADQPAAAKQTATAAAARSHAAGDVVTAQPATPSATPSMGALPVLSIEMGELVVSGSEAETDAIESAGVLNRLELFEF